MEGGVQFQPDVPGGSSKTDPLQDVGGTKILRSQLNRLKRLATDNGMDLNALLAKAEVTEGYITKLDLRYTNISNISSLRGLKKLKRLNLAQTKVSDLSPLEGTPALETIAIMDTPITNLGPLKKLKKLAGLTYGGNLPVIDQQLEALQKSLPNLDIGGL